MRVALVASFVCLTYGVIRRSDVPDSEYIVSPADHPQIVAVNPGGDAPYHLYISRVRARRMPRSSDFNVECAGTMISKKHAITAAHCFEDGASQKGFVVNVAGTKIKAAATHFNPSCQFHLKQDGPNRCDVAIVELESEADVEPFPVYHWDDETGKHMDIYGWGVTGNAASISKKDCNDGAEDGHFRHGENTVAEVSAPADGGGIIYYTMKENSDKGTLPHEAISASGDSGGPAFLKGPDNKTYIAGTNSGSNDDNGCRYGSTDQYCRLSRHYTWIQSVIAGGPSPGPSPPTPTPPGPGPTPTGQCTHKCLSELMELCPAKNFPTFNKCVSCGENHPKLEDYCKSEKAGLDCCHSLHPSESAHFV